MKTKKRLLGLIFVCFLFLFLKNAIGSNPTTATPEILLQNLQKEYEPVKPLVPLGILPKSGFREGSGPIVGVVQMEQGQVYVVHQGQYSAYQIKKDYPLYMGDMIATDERSRVNISLNDKSVFSLAPYSKLTIDKSTYDPERSERSSRFSLFFGRARFVVAAITGKNNYEIITPTAICGLRGSDIALAVTPNADALTSASPLFLGRFFSIPVAHAAVPEFLLTTLVTGANTTVSFSGMVGPAQIVGPYSTCAAASGGAAFTPMPAGAVVEEALNTVGPGMASISMPPQ